MSHPHHTISDVGLIGGGHVPLPGEVSPAHHGIPFLDELPEFCRHVLEVLRQPREEGVIYIQSRRYPGSRYLHSFSGTPQAHEEFGPNPVARICHEHSAPGRCRLRALRFMPQLPLGCQHLRLRRQGVL